MKRNYLIQNKEKNRDFLVSLIYIRYITLNH